MFAHDHHDLLSHVGHTIACVTYGHAAAASVAVECEDCGTVLLDPDIPATAARATEHRRAGGGP